MDAQAMRFEIREVLPWELGMYERVDCLEVRALFSAPIVDVFFYQFVVKFVQYVFVVFVIDRLFSVESNSCRLYRVNPKADAITFLADGTVSAFSKARSVREVHCFG